jgi:hypothetical protein
VVVVVEDVVVDVVADVVTAAVADRLVAGGVVVEETAGLEGVAVGGDASEDEQAVRVSMEVRTRPGATARTVRQNSSRSRRASLNTRARRFRA